LTAETTIQVPPEWLVRTWAMSGKKLTYDVYFNDWAAEYADLTGQIRAAVEAGIIDAEIQPHSCVIILNRNPRTVELLRVASRERPGPRTHGTQITTPDGTKYNTRSDYVRMILDADINILTDTVQGDLSQIRNSQNKKVRRRMKSELHDIILLRGNELPRDVYGSTCLRLGMPLLPEFWQISPERLPSNLGDLMSQTCVSIPRKLLERTSERHVCDNTRER
jgi:hypothetical protein